MMNEWCDSGLTSPKTSESNSRSSSKIIIHREMGMECQMSGMIEFHLQSEAFLYKVVEQQTNTSYLSKLLLLPG